MPGQTKRDISLENVSLETRLSDGLVMPLGFLSAAMQSVTNDTLAIALAQQGGMGVLPCSISIEEQIRYLKNVKRFKGGFVSDLITVNPNDLISRLIKLERKHGYSTFPVVTNGKLVGLIKDTHYHPTQDAAKRVSERMIPKESLVVGKEDIKLGEANRKMFDAGIGCLPIVDEQGNLVSMVFHRDYRKHKSYPDEFVDKDRRLMVGAAVSTHQRDYERAQALIENGVDAIFIDASQGYSQYQKDRIKELKDICERLGRNIPIFGGNVVSREAFDYLVEAGVSGVKIGQGGGSVCTTRDVKRTGRGNATALIEIAEARDEYYQRNSIYIPLCLDGGIETTGQMAIAFALGADLLMMGKYFARFEESAAPKTKRILTIVSQDGTTREETIDVREIWGEASYRAANLRRYGHESMQTFVSEGIEGYVMPRGRLEDGLAGDKTALRRILKDNGCSTIEELHKNSTVERLSERAIQLGRPNIGK